MSWPHTVAAFYPCIMKLFLFLTLHLNEEWHQWRNQILAQLQLLNGPKMYLFSLHRRKHCKGFILLSIATAYFFYRYAVNCNNSYLWHYMFKYCPQLSCHKLSAQIINPNIILNWSFIYKSVFITCSILSSDTVNNPGLNVVRNQNH